jgi:hypothetical protein
MLTILAVLAATFVSSASAQPAKPFKMSFRVVSTGTTVKVNAYLQNVSPLTTKSMFYIDGHYEPRGGARIDNNIKSLPGSPALQHQAPRYQKIGLVLKPGQKVGYQFSYPAAVFGKGQCVGYMAAVLGSSAKRTQIFGSKCWNLGGK